MFNVPNALFDAFRMETAVQLSTNDIHEIDPFMQGLMKACHSHLHGITTRFCCSGHSEEEQRGKYVAANGTMEGFRPSLHQEADIIFAVKEDNAEYLLTAYASWAGTMETKDHLKLHPSLKIVRLMNSRRLQDGPYFAIKVELYYRLDYITPKEAVDALNDFCRIVYDLQNAGKNVSPFPTNCSEIRGVTDPQQAYIQRQMDIHTTHGFYAGATKEENNKMQNEVRKQFGLHDIPLGKPIHSTSESGSPSTYFASSLKQRRENKDTFLARNFMLAFQEGMVYVPRSIFLKSELGAIVGNPDHPYNLHLKKWEALHKDVRKEKILLFATLLDSNKTRAHSLIRKCLNLPDEHIENFTLLQEHKPEVILKQFNYLLSGLGRGPDEIEAEELTPIGKLLKKLWESMPLVDQVAYFNAVRIEKGLEPFVYVECKNFEEWIKGAWTAKITEEKVKQSVLANKHR